jgi:deoxyribonuclease-4
MGELLLGAHVSISGSIDLAVDRAKEIGCTTFQIFTRSPRGWKFSSLKENEVKEFKRKVRLWNLQKPLAHMPYLPNLATPNQEAFKKSVETLIAEIKRCDQLGISYLVTHMGSHLGSGIDKGIERVAEACLVAIDKTRRNKAMILLENTAGTKNSVGFKFEHIRKVLDIVGSKRLGMCFDTCHAFAAGYDLRDDESLEGTLKELDRVIGLNRLKAVHLNDSKGDLGSNIDRHEHIGLGKIGDEGFTAILHNKRLITLPMVLETPEDNLRGHKENLDRLWELSKG